MYHLFLLIVLSSCSIQVSAQYIHITTNDTLFNLFFISIKTFNKYIEPPYSLHVKEKYIHKKDSIRHFNQLIEGNIIGKLPKNWHKLMIPNYKEASVIINVRYKIEVGRLFNKKVIYVGTNQSGMPKERDLHLIYMNGNYYMTSTYCYEKICSYLKIKM